MFEAFQRMMNVMHAVILRDIRSRYFNHGLGFLIVPLMPTAHALILLAVYTVTGRTATYGDDMFVFFSTGLIPALTFTYVSRFMSMSLIANKNMLSFPAVKLLDIILARSFLELIAIVISTLIMIVIIVTIGSNPIPVHPADALEAMACVSLLSVGVGIITSVISMAFPFFPLIYGLSMVIVYLSSGAPIYLHVFPEDIVYYMSFNPVFHAVEWMRSAYFLGYPTQDLDKQYLLLWAMGSIVTGLLMERYLKAYFLSN